MRHLLLVFFFLLLPASAFSAVSVTGSSTGACENHNGDNNLSWTSHAIAGGANTVLFIVIGVSDASVTISSVTLGAAGGTEVASVNNGGFTALHLWKIDAPNSGADTITVTASAEPAYNWCAFEFNTSGVASLGSPVTNNNDNVTAQSLDLVGVANGLNVDALFLENGNTATPGGSQTQIEQRNPGDPGVTLTLAASFQSGTGTLTSSWNFSTDNSAQIGVVLSPSGAAPVVRHRPIIQ